MLPDHAKVANKFKHKNHISDCSKTGYDTVWYNYDLAHGRVFGAVTEGPCAPLGN